ncbi:hypothetical protein [Halobacillus yeomjeoni]|uniref:Uncharacterized protein n=1 Tax=Halobacillus yeomjeoni TaxID=311194 RepID=A0A931HXN9_9BACI|nr:hypothetical protein [Halobacillus yeomjeoni]MBH0231310.1 hypothetical protein [Halobacillus yeomjeoni]
MLKKILLHLSDTWTFMIMSNAKRRVMSLKIPKCIGYVTLILIAAVSIGSIFSYQQANALFQSSEKLKKINSDQKNELEELQTQYKNLLDSTQKTRKNQAAGSD